MIKINLMPKRKSLKEVLWRIIYSIHAKVPVGDSVYVWGPDDESPTVARIVGVTVFTGNAVLDRKVHGTKIIKSCDIETANCGSLMGYVK